VTLIVGKCNGNKSRANIITHCDGADEPRSIELNLDSLKPGQPK